MRGCVLFCWIPFHARDWVFNPPKDYILRPGQTIVTMPSPAGRQELELLLVELSEKS